MDIASAALPGQVLEAAARMGVQAAVVHKTLGTVERFLAGERIEHTAFRRESYAAGEDMHQFLVQLGATLKEDALRRIFLSTRSTTTWPPGRCWTRPAAGLRIWRCGGCALPGRRRKR